MPNDRSDAELVRRCLAPGVSLTASGFESGIAGLGPPLAC